MWAALWSLPEHADIVEARAWFDRHADGDFDAARAGDPILHGFSHYRLHIEPLGWRLAEPGVARQDDHRWQPFDQLADVGLPAPVKKLLGSLTP